MGRILFCSLQPWVGYFFPLPWSQWEDIYRKENAVAVIYFTEIANSIEMQLRLQKWTGKTFLHRTQPVQRILWVVIFFDDSTYEKNTIYRNIKIYCLIVWGKMIECHGVRTFFFLAVSHGANTFFHLFFFFFFCHVTLLFFHTTIYVCTGPMPQ